MILHVLSLRSRQAGGRFGEYLEKMVPLIVHFCKTDDDELTEFCLQAFESFVRRCPKEVSIFIPDVSEISQDVVNVVCIDDEDVDEIPSYW